jgi:hypothetical protein
MARSTMPFSPRRPELGPAATLPFALLVVAAFAILRMFAPQVRGTRTNRFVQASVLTLFFAVALAACGGGGGSVGSGPTVGTPAGTYTLTVTATVAGASQTIKLTLVVQ